MNFVAVGVKRQIGRGIMLSAKPLQVLGPVGQSSTAQPLDGPSLAVLFDKTPGGENVILRTRTDEGEGDWPERELEEPASERGYIVVVAFGRRLGDDLDLAVAEAEAPVYLARGGVGRLRVRQIEPCRAGLENHVAMSRIGDLAEALRREYDRRVLFAQRAQPLLDLRSEDAACEHHPGLIQDDERRAAVEPLVDAMEEVGDDRHDHLRAHRHQGFELEGDERAFEHHVAIGVEKAPERAGERKGAEPVADRLVLHLGDEVADGPLLRRRLGDERHRAPERLALVGDEANALQLKPVFEQRRELHAVGFLVDAGERLQRNVIFPEVQMLPAERPGENEGGITLVEEKDLAFGNRAEVCRDRAEGDALAAAGRAEHRGMSRIADVQVQPERRAAAGRAVAKRGRVLRIVGAGVGLQSGPDAGERQDVGEVLGSYEWAADIVPAVAGKRAEPRLDRVDGLDARVEAHVLTDLEDQLRVLVGDIGPLLSDDDLGRRVAEADRAALGLGDGLIGVRRHLQRMLVLEGGAGAGTEMLADHAPQSEPLLEPVAAIDRKLAYRGARANRDAAHRIAVADGQLAQERRHLGVRERRKAGERDDTDMAPADARLESRDEVQAADDRIEVNRRTRRDDPAYASVDAAREMRKQ